MPNDMNAEARTILLIDDEDRVLRALARRLKTISPDWEILTATGGNEAMEILAKTPCDLVVSDLQMPLMDGGVFLTKVRDTYPKIIRFALSGHAQQELMLKAISLAHQYFAKPCDSTVLANAIAAALSSTESMHEERMKEILVRLNQFPPFPSIYRELVDVLEDGNASMERVSSIVIRDPAITAKVLQVANSSFFGAGRKISVLEEAVAMLGTEALKALVLVFNFMQKTQPATTAAITPEIIWAHSVNVGEIASRIAEEFFQDGKMRAELTTIAILHDLGKWVLLNFSPERYDVALLRSKDNKVPLWLTEKQEFGASHAEVGSMLFQLWGLPERLTEAVLWHHQPGLSSKGDKQLLAALHIGDMLEYVCAQKQEYYAALLDSEFLKSLNLPAESAFWEDWAFKSKNP